MSYPPPPPPPPPAPPQPGNGFAVAALVCGISGATLGLIPLFFIVAFAAGTLAIIFGFVGRGRVERQRATGKGMARAGIILGAVALALGVIGVVIVNDAFEDLDRELDRGSDLVEENDAGASVTTTTQPERVTISLAAWEQIETGMTYDEVVAIVGGPGEQLVESEIVGHSGAAYMWEGESLGANAIVQFQDGRVVTKAQFGLE